MAADQIHVTKAGRRAPAVLMVLIAAFIASGATAIRAVAAVPPEGLHVAGNRLLDGQGQRVTLRGVNRSGTEYACIQGFGIFDGPSNASSVHAIASWHVKFVREPMNEDCGHALTSVKRVDSGIAYRRAILRSVVPIH